MRCPACGYENVNGKRFCKSCGAPLAPTCPACAAVLDDDSRFCDECGTPVTASVARESSATSVPASTPLVPAPAAKPEAAQGVVPLGTERRHVSVLFCDLVGFTPLSESKDPEEVRELLSGYFDLSRA
ncbi:MAG: zinc-ribbon domain-containing protein, partial [Acidimicrobiales bacterium]